MEDTKSHLDTLLTDKVKEIIESQWGKSLTDLKDLRVEQFYERRILEGRISYRPVNRYAIQATFYTARESRRLTFNLTA